MAILSNRFVSIILVSAIAFGMFSKVPEERLFAETVAETVKSLTVVCGNTKKLSSGSSKVVWKSSDPKIAAVDKNGKITAKKAGKTTITASSSGKIDSYEIRVLYKDVTSPKDFWYEPVNKLTEGGVVKGYAGQTEFRPANECTRAQMLTFLWRLQGQPKTKSDKCNFPDVKASDYFYKPVIWAEEKGITTGYKDGTFKPQEICTRAHAVTFMWRMSGKPSPKTSVNKFPDVKKTDYFYKSSLWAYENKILVGMSDGTFNPQGKCLRRQMVTFLYKYDKYINRRTPSTTPTPSVTLKPTARPSATAKPTAKPTAVPSLTVTPAGKPSTSPTLTPQASVSPTVIPDDLSANLTVSFADGFKHPSGARFCIVSLYDDEDQLAVAPLTLDIENGINIDAYFEKVPLDTVKVNLVWLDINENVIAEALVEGNDFPEIQKGQDSTIFVSDYSLEVRIKIENAYALAVDKIDAEIEYIDGTLKKINLSGISFDKDKGACSLSLGTIPLTSSISSVVLLYDGVPFEWLDYNDPQLIPNSGLLSLDVNDNEFANGIYSAGNVMMVANPRQLDNVRNHLNGTYEQIKDIDFAGSCGISNEMFIYEEDGQKYIDCKMIDLFSASVSSGNSPEPRFYGGNDNVFGWNPIGDEADPFTGNYNGKYHSISNLITNSVGKWHSVSALFGFVIGTDSNPVKIGLIDILASCSFASSYVSAPLIAQAKGCVGIEECKVSADVYSGEYAAGLVGESWDPNVTSLNEETWKHEVTLNICECVFDGKLYCQFGGGMLSRFCEGIVNLTRCVYENGEEEEEEEEGEVVVKNGIIYALRGVGGLIYQAGLCGMDSCIIDDCHSHGVLNAFQDYEDRENECSSYGGFIGYLKGTLEIIGQCEVKSRFVYDGGNIFRVGGVVGFTDKYDIPGLKHLFNGVVSVESGCILESKHEQLIGQFCGSPWLDDPRL